LPETGFTESVCAFHVSVRQVGSDRKEEEVYNKNRAFYLTGGRRRRGGGGEGQGGGGISPGASGR